MSADLEAVVGLVNTVDLESGVEVLETPEALRGWLVAHAELDPAVELDAADLADALELREALRALALSHHDGGDPPAAAAATLDRLAARARLTLQVGTDGDVALTPTADRPVDRALGRLLAAVHVASVEGTWQRFKACPWDTCRWGFIDHSKNRSRTWCSMDVCGNRAKARAFRARRRATT
jgi:predicted RNA-binding Zn ribbon-like protein